jgi:hypothetical protein
VTCALRVLSFAPCAYGVYGWNNWSYGHYERRIGGRTHHGERIGVELGSRRTNSSIETRTRSTTRSGVETRTRSTTGSGLETRTRSTTGSGVEGGVRVREGTKGGTPDADVQSSGGAKVQGGPTGEGTSMRGGGNAGGGRRRRQLQSGSNCWHARNPRLA